MNHFKEGDNMSDVITDEKLDESSDVMSEEDEKGYKGKDLESKFPKKAPKYKKKVCRFCVDKEMEKGLDYKRVDILEKFITNRGKIMPRRLTGTCAKHQRILAREIRKARYIGLLPFKVI